MQLILQESWHYPCVRAHTHVCACAHAHANCGLDDLTLTLQLSCCMVHVKEPNVGHFCSKLRCGLPNV